MPSARISAALISCSRSTRTSVIRRVIRLAQRGIKIEGFFSHLRHQLTRLGSRSGCGLNE